MSNQPLQHAGHHVCCFGAAYLGAIAALLLAFRGRTLAAFVAHRCFHRRASHGGHVDVPVRHALIDRPALQLLTSGGIQSVSSHLTPVDHVLR